MKEEDEKPSGVKITQIGQHQVDSQTFLVGLGSDMKMYWWSRSHQTWLIHDDTN